MQNKFRIIFASIFGFFGLSLTLVSSFASTVGISETPVNLTGIDKLIHMIVSFINQFLPLILILVFVTFLIALVPSAKRFLGGFV